MRPQLKYKDNSGVAKESRYLSVFEGLSWNNLLIFDIETKKSKEIGIPDSGSLMKQESLITLLPDGDLFCVGKGDEYSDSITQGACFIIDKKCNIKQSINLNFFKKVLYAIYYDGDIYIFGSDQYWLKRIQVKKYSLRKKRFSSMGVNANRLTFSCCDVFVNAIILTGYEERFICIYDIFSNSFTELSLDLKAYSAKVICSRDDKAYIISVSEGIYESGLFNPYEWTLLSKTNIASCHCYGLIANYKDCCYFLHGKTYYWFNFNDKALNRVIRGLF
ncbi:unnamed protein product [Blepharisma stoltei]|uniref:Uncharacterized protein n=1 Tax=Blepharisma stoltei TaxID=1481888 RepID=A0AAU9K3X6_9CILI|nr:unnamed protein product [Blepharisma stoltei]